MQMSKNVNNDVSMNPPIVVVVLILRRARDLLRFFSSTRASLPLYNPGSCGALLAAKRKTALFITAPQRTERLEESRAFCPVR